MRKKWLILAGVSALVVAGGVAAAILAAAQQAKDTGNVPAAPQEAEMNAERSGGSLTAVRMKSRDVERKNELSRTITNIYMYQANNTGRLPADFTAYRDQYLLDGDAFADPLLHTTYEFRSESTRSPEWRNESDRGIIFYAVGYVCGEADDSLAKSSSRSVALRIALESGGSYCAS